MAPSSYEEVTAILAQCRISHFRQAFLDNECDDSFLDIVEDGDLRELGLPLGPRVRLLKAVADRNAARAARAPAPAVTPPRTFAPPPPPAAPASPRNEDNLCELCADREVDCAIAGCEHKFCRVCVDLWRRESVRKAQQNTMCPNCRAPFTEVVDLETGRAAAAAAAPPRPAWGAAPPPPPVSLAATAAEEEARRRREAEAREAAERERAAAAREAAERERAAAARAREAEQSAAENAAAVATFYATREAPQWALRVGTGKSAAEVRAEASERARAAMWGAGATAFAVEAYVEAYAAAATGAFVHAEAQALAKDRDDAAAAVISAFIGEVVSATRRDAASAALAEVATAAEKREKNLAEVERRILELVDENHGEITVGFLQNGYTKRYGQKLDWKALGFGRLLGLIESLRSVVLAPVQGSHANRKIRRVPRILQRPAAAPAPAAAQRRLSGDAGEFRPASPAQPPMYAQPPIPPPPHGFVPVFAPPPPLFVPVFPGERLAWPPPPGAPPPLPGAPILMPIGGIPPANWRRGGGMHYMPNQPEDEG